eukprot:scaffold106_cov380-Prasinococcus_capsulatus_cf.AAC.4
MQFGWEPPAPSSLARLLACLLARSLAPRGRTRAWPRLAGARHNAAAAAAAHAPAAAAAEGPLAGACGVVVASAAEVATAPRAGLAAGRRTGSIATGAAMAVLLETTRGDVVIDLHTELCPITCKNFLKLCKCAPPSSRSVPVPVSLSLSLCVCLSVSVACARAARRGVTAAVRACVLGGARRRVSAGSAGSSTTTTCSSTACRRTSSCRRATRPAPARAASPSTGAPCSLRRAALVAETMTLATGNPSAARGWGHAQEDVRRPGAVLRGRAAQGAEAQELRHRVDGQHRAQPQRLAVLLHRRARPGLPRPGARRNAPARSAARRHGAPD